MELKTSRKINTTPARLWPLLFHSKMDEQKPCYFLFGLPKPMECRLADGSGGVGATRECVSDKGLIQQTILEWVPEQRLQFEMRETSIYFGPCVDAIIETFVLEPVGDETTKITRTTRFTLKPPARLWASIPMWIGLKSIHRYVFRNWRELAARKPAAHEV